MKRWVWVVLFLLGTFGIVQGQDVANWTILHYTAVDNNLEGAAFNDYYEMQSAGSGDGVNIVTQFDRAEGHETRFGDWTGTQRFYIEQVPAQPTPDMADKRAALVGYFTQQGYSDVAPQIEAMDDATVNSIYENNNVGVSFDQTPIEDLGEVDMGDPQSLTDFIVWGAANFPANHYMIVIGSHGGGWRGIGPDEGAGEPSMLEMPEIDAALSAAQEQLGIEKFDIVGFDACLMGVTDVAVMLESHADYVLFSQEVIPGNGWEYAKSITAMKENPDWDTFQVGANFVDNYMAYYAGEGARTKVDLGLVQTAGLPALVAALQNFAAVVGADPVELISALGTARNNSQSFAVSLADGGEYYSYIDLKDFIKWFSVQTTITEEAYNAAQEVLAAYDGAVAYSLADSKLPGSNGLGIYLPATPQVFAAYGEAYPVSAPAPMAFWQDYLNGFYATVVSTLDGSALQLEISNVFTLGETGSTLDTPIISFDAAGKGVVDMVYSVFYMQDDGTQIIVDTAPIAYTSVLPTGETVIEYPNELTPSTFKWGVEFPNLSDGTNTVLGLLQSSGASSSESRVFGTYVSAQGNQTAVLIFDSATYEYKGMLAQAEGGAPYEARPQLGEQFIVDMVTITPEGEVKSVPLDGTPLTFGVTPFTLTYAPAISGNYSVGLSIKDLAGNNLYKQVDLTINNDAVDGSMRGYTDINAGVHFVYPFAWGDTVTFNNDDGTTSDMASFEQDGQMYSITATAYADTDPQAALDAALSTLAVEIGDVTEATLGGLPALRLDYSYESDAGTMIGALFSVVNPESGAAIVFQMDAAGGEDNLTALIGMVDGSLFLFAPR